MSRIVEERKSFFRIVFLTSAVSMTIFLLLLMLAMILYPGGNFRGIDLDHYSLVYNGICDMREVTAVNGDPNLPSRILLRSGIVFFSFSSTLFSIALCFFFQERTSTKILSFIALLFGVAQGPLNAMIIIHSSPFVMHMTFIIIAQLFQYLAVIMFTIVFFIDRKLPKLNLYSFLSLSIISIVFAIIVGFGPVVGGDFHFITNRLGTNLFNYLSIIIYIIQGLSLFFFLKKERQPIAN
jgi:hypothetical protein